MDTNYPKDCKAREISTAARSMVVNSIDPQFWDWHEQTGTDHGTDMVFELIENGEYRNNKIECQIKGTTRISFLESGDVSFKLDVKTVNYACNCNSAFILLVADISERKVYYVVLQDYFSDAIIASIKEGQKTINIHINKDMILTKESSQNLKRIAKRVYVNGTIVG